MSLATRHAIEKGIISFFLTNAAVFLPTFAYANTQVVACVVKGGHGCTFDWSFMLVGLIAGVTTGLYRMLTAYVDTLHAPVATDAGLASQASVFGVGAASALPAALTMLRTVVVAKPTPLVAAVVSSVKASAPPAPKPPSGPSPLAVGLAKVTRAAVNTAESLATSAASIEKKLVPHETEPPHPAETPVAPPPLPVVAPEPIVAPTVVETAPWP